MNKTFENFKKELEAVKTILFDITTEEVWYGYFQHSDSDDCELPEDGEDSWTAEEFAQANGVYHETVIFNLEGDGIVDPTKSIEEGRVVEKGTAKWKLEDFFGDIMVNQFTYGSEDTLSEAIYRVITSAIVGVHDDETALTQTIDAYPDSKLLWYSNLDIIELNHYPHYPKEILKIIERYEEFEKE